MRDRLFIGGLALILFGSLLILLTPYWHLYATTYLLLLLCYTWYVFALLFLGRRPLKYEYKDYSVAVIIPTYNEDPKLLERCINSVIETIGRKHIYVIDDGSAVPVEWRGASLSFLSISRLNRNEGKRRAVHYAVTKLIRDEQIIVTIDSDTVLHKEALRELCAPFSDSSIGATTGDVRLLNEGQNILTRMIGSYYWIGLHIYKKAQSSLGMVVCCSGCLAAYRRSIMQEIIDPFLYQSFLGSSCTHSEDRHLTNLVLERRWRVCFAPTAVSYTETPATLKGFLKQQQRWKRGFIRESIYTLSYSWRTRPVLFLEVILWDLTVPFFSFGLMMALIYTILFATPLFLTTVLPAWIIFMSIRYMPMLFYAPAKSPGLLIYMLVYDFTLYWQSIYALFTVKNKGWLTR